MTEPRTTGDTPTPPDAPRPLTATLLDAVKRYGADSPSLSFEFDRILAARLASPDPELDVERLARAILAAKWYAPDGRADALTAAQIVAAAYARLSSPTDE